MRKKKIILIVLDSVGCGNAPDAHLYGDEGANTLGHILDAENPKLPNMKAMGLWSLLGKQTDSLPTGAYGCCEEKSAGKDTTIGHWEIAGLITPKPLPTFPNGFPGELITAFEKAIGRGTLGNYAASGTEIIQALGREHMETGSPIVYTSADSVFQIAAHEDIIPAAMLWDVCKTARSLLVGDYAVGRVIARPFVGAPGAFARTGNRRDFSLEPFAPTMLDILKENSLDVIGVGKIEDIFAHRGLTASNHASGNPACIEALLDYAAQPVNGLIFANLVDFDSIYGHRNDVKGYARALEEFDQKLPEIMATLGAEDLLLITADHGCDPTYPGTDHTRERVPLLCWGKAVIPQDLGVRQTYADIASTVLAYFGLPNAFAGTSFYAQLKGGPLNGKD